MEKFFPPPPKPALVQPPKNRLVEIMAARNDFFGAGPFYRPVWHLFPLLLGAVLPLQAQPAAVPGPKPPPPRVEPGMENAVRWRWLPEKSDEAVWGLPEDAPPPVPVPGAPPVPGTTANPQGPPSQAVDYQVQKGDSLYVIAKRYSITVDQLKAFNQMKKDMIVLGQTLRIPSLADIQAMAPPPPPPPPEPKVKKSKAPPKAQKVAEDDPNRLLKRPLPSPASTVARIVLMQSYLDRQNFSAGPIDGSDGPLYDAALRSYEESHPGELTYDMGQMPEALKKMGGAYTEFQLRKEDMRWILPEPPAPPAPSGRKGRNAPPPPPAPEVTLESLTSVKFLAYRSVWEFVAERYHCSESFLRRINPGLKSPVSVGALFFVPNVVPFEIENAFKEPLRPAANAARPLVATIVGNNRLEIREGEMLVANLPVSVARPGLRGRGTWKILDAIPRPQMTTTGDPAAPLSTPLVLPPGPNNPAGPFWINLAKAKDEPLPYGLHGTSIPGYMNRQESIGGFRMTNWDIARVVRMLPEGTPLKWQ